MSAWTKIWNGIRAWLNSGPTCTACRPPWSHRNDGESTEAVEAMDQNRAGRDESVKRRGDPVETKQAGAS
jgi:hypothetical protein